MLRSVAEILGIRSNGNLPYYKPPKASVGLPFEPLTKQKVESIAETPKCVLMFIQVSHCVLFHCAIPCMLF